MSVKAKNIAALSVEELQKRVQEEKSLLAKLKFAHGISPIENPMRIRYSKKEIARLETALTAKNR